MWFNYVLESAILANVLAQILKVPLRLITKKEWRPSLVLSTGGMPSSHSAFVAAMLTAVGFVDGVHSTTFAISFCLAAVVIYDAMGIRRHAGEHAKMLNQLLDDLKKNGNLSVFHDESYQKRFKELLGHEPLETFFGTLFGVFIATLYGIIIGII